jgi:hypothetical protein
VAMRAWSCDCHWGDGNSSFFERDCRRSITIYYAFNILHEYGRYARNLLKFPSLNLSKKSRSISSGKVTVHYSVFQSSRGQLLWKSDHIVDLGSDYWGNNSDDGFLTIEFE